MVGLRTAEQPSRSGVMPAAECLARPRQVTCKNESREYTRDSPREATTGYELELTQCRSRSLTIIKPSRTSSPLDLTRRAEMDVDTPTEAAPANQDELVAELGELLEQVAEQPSNLRLLRRQVELMLQLDMIDEAVDAAEALHAKAFVGEGKFVTYVRANYPQRSGSSSSTRASCLPRGHSRSTPSQTSSTCSQRLRQSTLVGLHFAVR